MTEKKSDESDVESPFRCCDCGSTDFRVEQSVDVTSFLVSELPCTCGHDEDSVAARRSESVAIRYAVRGWLDPDRHWHEEEREEVGVDREIEEEEIYCARCVRRAQAGDWIIEGDDTEAEPPEDIEIWIYCAGCDREIEFGYSHPNRGGRIWLEDGFDRDFNPWKTWPEPRYVERWRARGWLRPTTPKGPASTR